MALVSGPPPPPSQLPRGKRLPPLAAGAVSSGAPSAPSIPSPRQPDQTSQRQAPHVPLPLPRGFSQIGSPPGSSPRTGVLPKGSALPALSPRPSVGQPLAPVSRAEGMVGPAGSMMRPGPLSPPVLPPAPSVPMPASPTEGEEQAVGFVPLIEEEDALAGNTAFSGEEGEVLGEEESSRDLVALELEVLADGKTAFKEQTGMGPLQVEPPSDDDEEEPGSPASRVVNAALDQLHAE
eukprot:TRINITY_DN48497_c0_g1_i1.p1 TRINITY_DN48497_c0_g1~~TRINITY_DN48497_c0_g1_i1.p1  ORF type:complete len:249 (-),score=44.70 TRINITY_DN48497_c0_g1_i1:92-799(-)